jgi:hypothetical protein
MGIMEVFIADTVSIGKVRTDVVEPVRQEDQVMEVIVFWNEALGDDMFACPLDILAREFRTWKPMLS